MRKVVEAVTALVLTTNASIWLVRCPWEGKGRLLTSRENTPSLLATHINMYPFLMNSQPEGMLGFDGFR
jgi:hypothetical protein